MIKITDKHDCCGCSACELICPKHCITMKEDEEGFLYPKVNINVCIDCKLCEKVCPVHHVLYGKGIECTYTVCSKDKENLVESASGGSFMPLAEFVIDKGGVAFGAVFDNNMRLNHQYTDSKDEIKKFRGSKYVQSDIAGSFKMVKSFLKEGRMVLFSGTPCQVQGLYNFLKSTNIKNLITLDFVCHGVPSPKIFRKYIEYTENKYDAQVRDYKFRTKKYGYNGYSYSYSYSYLSNGKSVWADNEDKYAQFMTKSFFAEMTSRPSCSKCAFKNKNHVSDFTVFDCWHWKQLSKNIDGTMGATTMVVNTPNGKMIFDEIKSKFLYESSNIDTAIKLDGISMLHSIPANHKRNAFFRSLDTMTIPQLYEVYLEPRGFAKIKEQIKSILDRYKILTHIRILKYKLRK